MDSDINWQDDLVNVSKFLSEWLVVMLGADSDNFQTCVQR